ncbi:MAG: DUF3859 domain-containing protein [Oscillatoriales cyanobacterium C42_A2020_001]|nr:DUF3859 domain-containing protein [Leptolyngbyaceae cyanobacterium C42_A2020_001]
MNNRLTQEQLRKIVAEVGELDLRRQQELEANQVREILMELDLPPELLEDAMVQLRRREALAVQERRQRWIAGSALACLIIAIAGTGFWMWQGQQSLNRVAAQQDRITLVQDDGGNLEAVTRPAEVVYRVTLRDAPVDKTLSLRCDWLDPGGQVVKQVQYETRTITTAVWDTRCRYIIGAEAVPGNWMVKLWMGNRLLSDATLEVK